MQNLSFVSSAIPDILGGSQNLKVGHDPGNAPLWPNFVFLN